MLTLAEITLGRPDWLWPATAIVLAASLLQVWRYRGTAMAPSMRFAAGGLKVAGILLLCLCLLDVRWIARRVEKGSNLFIVLADRGRGLEIRESADGETRAELIGRALRREGPEAGGDGWQKALEEIYDVRRYAFADRLESVGDFEELTFDGRRSELGSALKLVARRYRNRPVAGILVLSDGNATDLGDASDLGDAFFENVPPIYTVVAGGELAVKDLAITEVHVSQTVFEDAPVNMDVDVTAWKYQGKTVILRLLDEAGLEVENQTYRVPSDDDSHRFRLRVRPEKTGVLFYRLEIAEKGPAAEGSGPGDPEATDENNGRLVMVNRPRGPYRILYVSGRPNWEYKFLRRALLVDSQVEMVGLMRIARREPKFEWRGRTGESSNPLFRGFGKEDVEEGAGYDKPVIVRLDTQDAAELSEGFPDSAEALFADYEAVILDDVEAAFFTSDQMQLMEEFVSRRGGGFIMLGGQESFRSGDYEHTPIAQLLPVYLDRIGAPGGPGPLRFELTKEGWLEPWLRLRPREEDERLRLEEMSRLRVLNRLHAIKPGASVLATVADEQARNFPAVVAQRFGEGRVLAVTVGDLWRWGFDNESSHADMEKAWRQMARWVMADVPRQVMLTAGRGTGEAAGRGVRIEARVRDREFQPLENARVELVVTDSGGEDTEVTAQPSIEESGLYEATLNAIEDGGYRVIASVTGDDGETVSTEQTGWTVDAVSEEFRRTVPNEELMKSIAQRSGGASVSLADLPGFVKSLPEREAPVMEVKSDPLWHTPWVFLLALACFGAEWGIRRREGLV